MAKRTIGEREPFWRDLIGRQPASGLSIARFCKEAGVSANSFFVWKRRLCRQAGELERGRGASRQRKESSPRKSHPAEKSFVPLRLIADPVHRNASNAATIEVEWPSGLVVRVPAGFDAGMLRELLDAIQPATDAETPSC